MSVLHSLSFASALSVAALAALAFGPKPPSTAPQLPAHEPSPPIEFTVDPEQAELLNSTAVGLIELKIAAQSSQADVKVSVYLSPGLELVSGELAYLDKGEGEVLLLEKIDAHPQWVQLYGTATRDDGESFARHELFGEQKAPVMSGAHVIDGVVTFDMQWE